MPPAAPPNAKLRLLCLHGYQQDATIFRSKTGSWRQSVKSQAEFFFCTGPHSAKEGFEGRPPEGNSWCVGSTHRFLVARCLVQCHGGVCACLAATAVNPNRATESFSPKSYLKCRWSWEGEGDRPSLATEYTGWAATEAAIVSAMEAHAPIDGILSFSQGACCAAVYVVQAQLSSSLPKPNFVIFISGFLPRDESWAKEMLETGISVPTLHVFGETDAIIPMDRSKKLQGVCGEQAQVLSHPGGHFVPTCNAQVKQSVREFFSQQAARLRVPQGTADTPSSGVGSHSSHNL